MSFTIPVHEEPAPENGYQLTHAWLLMSSFHRWTGKRLVDSAGPEHDQARLLFEAPRAVVSHDTADDPIFNYGNATALRLFEMSWEEFTRLPSRMSAEPMARAERARLLEEVARHNFIEDYAGVRISASGRRFHIQQAIVWNLVDRAGVYRGQAACFDTWTEL